MLNKFVARAIPLGTIDSLSFEMGVCLQGEQVWVLLRERDPSARKHPPMLTGCVESVANAVRQELVYLKSFPDNLRFFHLTYEFKQSGQLSWAVKEIGFRLHKGWYNGAMWNTALPEEVAALSAALRLTPAPSRMCP